MLEKDIELYYRSLWPSTVDFSILESSQYNDMSSYYMDKEKTSYKLSDDDVINLCMIKIFMVEQGWWFELFWR